jgi:hypothetical protein
MYEDFTVTDRWTGEQLHVTWRGTLVAIATRHADATDIRFDVSGKPVWIALPNLAWVEQKRRTGKVITDYLAAQIGGRYLKQAIESGYDNGREMYTMTIEEVGQGGRRHRKPSLAARHQRRRRAGEDPGLRHSRRTRYPRHRASHQLHPLNTGNSCEW